jgi:GNAT superfamily N-acetyltransferase
VAGDLIIRNLTEDDISQVRELMQASFIIDTDFYLDYYPIAPRFRTLVAEINQTIIGVAAKYYNTTHPLWPTMMVVVDAKHRRQGIGRKLHDETLKVKPPEHEIHGWQGACYQEDNKEITFMQALGYKHCLDCNILELDLLGFNHHVALPKHFEHLTIVTFTELLKSEMKQKIFDFLVGRYIENHFWSTPVPKEHPEWADTLEEVRPELSFALLDGDTVVAASSVVGESKNILDMCWAYSTLEHGQENAQIFLKYLLAQQFTEAKKVGLTQANLELDSTDQGKQDLLEWFPVQKQQVWQIFQKPV